jgi:hypothetical protein
MGFITRAIGRRIQKSLLESAQTPEGQAAIERGRRRWLVMETARTIAGRELDDQAALVELGEVLPGDQDSAREAIVELAEHRNSYLDDRAYRLLTAVVDGTAVRPIDPAVRDQFLAEAQLGHMSLGDAFEQLVSLEPRLGEFVRRQSEGSPPKQGWSRTKDGSELHLVGRFAESPYDLVKTDLASSVVREYVGAGAYGSAPRDDPTPFFERRKHTGGFTFALFEKDTRPRARN